MIPVETDRHIRRIHAILFLLVAAAFTVAPLFAYPIFLMKVMCFALFAVAFNLLLGYGGLLSFGHSAYFGMSSYVTAWAAITVGLTPELAIAMGVVAAALLALVFGVLAVRRQGIYFAMITLSLAQMVYFFALQTPDFTGGEDGIQGVPRGRLFGILDLSGDWSLYWVVLAIFMGSLLLVYRIIHSPFGQICKAIRDNEPRAISLGYRANTYKVQMFVVSGALAGLAGSLKVLVFELASLTDVHWLMSGEVILMTLIGGLGTIFGPIAGALVTVSMQNYLSGLGEWVSVVQGLVFVVCVLAFREGIVGVIGRWLRRPL